MYPLRDPELTFHDVGRNWRRHLPGRPKRDEVYGDLIRGFWRGELPLRSLSNNLLPVDRQTALAALRELTARAEADPLTALDPAGFLFLAFWSEDEEGELGPLQARPVSGGVLSEDQRIRIHLPQERAAWTPAIVDAALKAVAVVGFEGLPLSFRRKVAALWVRWEDFAAFCDLRGYDAPGWWLGPKQNPLPNAVATGKGGRPAIWDEPLLEKMHELIARSCGRLRPRDAAKQVIDQAEGTGDDAKLRRLTRKYPIKYKT